MADRWESHPPFGGAGAGRPPLTPSAYAHTTVGGGFAPLASEVRKICNNSKCSSLLTKTIFQYLRIALHRLETKYRVFAGPWIYVSEQQWTWQWSYAYYRKLFILSIEPRRPREIPTAESRWHLAHCRNDHQDSGWTWGSSANADHHGKYSSWLADAFTSKKTIPQIWTPYKVLHFYVEWVFFFR